MLKSRKGSYLVEATILYPFVISAAVMIFVLFIVYFENTHYIYQMSHYSRIRSSNAMGTVIYGMDENDNTRYDLYQIRERGSTLTKSVTVMFKRRIKDDLLYRFKSLQAFNIKHTEINEARAIWATRHLTDP